MGPAKAFTGYPGPTIASFTELKPRIEPDCGITFVIGGNLNPFGHALFRMGRRTGYTHVDELCAFPKFIPWYSFGTYLRGNHKRILRELTIALPHPLCALRKTLELNYKRWPWLGIPHNCVAYGHNPSRAFDDRAARCGYARTGLAVEEQAGVGLKRPSRSVRCAGRCPVLV
jgi:hypothetical protein